VISYSHRIPGYFVNLICREKVGKLIGLEIFQLRLEDLFELNHFNLTNKFFSGLNFYEIFTIRSLKHDFLFLGFFDLAQKRDEVGFFPV